MRTTKLSSKGQVIIPKYLRASYHWEAGQELIVVDVGDGILLKNKMPFEQKSIHDAASCLKYTGKTKTLDDMESAISKGVADHSK